MADLSVTYLGLRLKNPIIIGACNLSSKPDFFEKAEKAGASAIVYNRF
jgi:dihydroorotate dehydrogenase (fumarate)